MLIRSAPAMSDLEDESPLLAFDGLREGSNGPASGLIDTSTQRRLDSELAGPAGVQKGFLRIEGMTCAVCSGTIERALQFTDGVSSGKVSLLTETCEVLYDPAVVSVEEIMEEIQDVGFGAKVMPRSKQGQGQVVLSLIAGVSQADMLRMPPFFYSEPGIHRVSMLRAGEGGARHARIELQVDFQTTKLRETLHAWSEQYNLGRSGEGWTMDCDGDVLARKREFQEQRTSELIKFQARFWLSMKFTVPLLLLSFVCPFLPLLHDIVMWQVLPPVSLNALMAWALCSHVQFKSGRSFYISAYKSVKHGAASMDVLIVLGSTAAYVYSVVSILVSLYSGIIHPMFFETSAMLISVVLLGKYTESIAKGRTSEAMERLLDLQPSTASVCVWDDPKERFQLDKYLLQLEADLARQQLEDGAGGSSAHTNRDREEAKASQAGSSDSKGDDKPSLTTQLAEQLSTCITRCVDFRLVQVGDVIKVGRGEKVPCDGVVVCGQSSVDEAIITGESMPQSKRPGSDVIGCTVNMSSVLYVKVRAIGSDTVLSRVVQLVNDAQTQKAPIQDFANRVAAYFVPMVVAFSALTFVVWYVVLSSEWVVIDTAGDSHFLFSLMFAIAVLVVSCPCSLGLATPTAVMVGAGVAAKLGILFKGGVPLEVTGRTDVVMFDKTGTLTKGQPNVDVSNTTVFDTTSGAHTEIYGDVDEEIKKTFWALVAACETDSEHIIGRAIVGYFHKYVGAKLPAHTDFHAVNGLGVKATVKGVKVLVGNERWLTQTHSVILDEDAKHEMRRVCDRGSIGVYVALDGVCAGIVALSDPLKRNALDVVRGLRAAGVDVYIVTGDNRRTANVIAGMVEIPPHRVISEATPAGKAAAVKDLRAQRKTVMFVGDGVNDAPALAHADVSVAIGTGTDIAVEAASVVLMKSDLNDILVAFDLSRHVLRRIHINFVFAIVYNLVSIPFAAGMFFPVLHIQIHPAMAALMMGMSSVSVVLSSLWLKRYTPPANPHSSSIRAHARSRGAAGAPTSRNGGYSELFQDLPGPALGDMTTSDDDLGMDHV